jgi:hypothetical protein
MLADFLLSIFVMENVNADYGKEGDVKINQ